MEDQEGLWRSGGRLVSNSTEEADLSRYSALGIRKNVESPADAVRRRLSQIEGRVI